MPRNQFEKFEPIDEQLFKNEVSDKLRQLDARLEILARTAENQIDVLNNKVASLQTDNDLLRQALESSEGFNAVTIDKSRVDATLRVGLDMESISLGFEAFSNPGGDPYVRIYPGEIQIGDNSPVTIAQTDVSITADDTYVYLKYDYVNGTFTAGADTAKPVSDGSYYYKWLCLVGLTGDYARIKEYGYLGGNINIPAIFNP